MANPSLQRLGVQATFPPTRGTNRAVSRPAVGEVGSSRSIPTIESFRRPPLGALALPSKPLEWADLEQPLARKVWIDSVSIRW